MGERRRGALRVEFDRCPERRSASLKGVVKIGKQFLVETILDTTLLLQESNESIWKMSAKKTQATDARIPMKLRRVSTLY